MKFFPVLLVVVLFSCGNEVGKPIQKQVKPGNLQFFEVYLMDEISDQWNEACRISAEMDTTVQQKKGLSAYIQIPVTNTPGYIKENGMHAVDSILAIPEISKLFPKDLRFMWDLNSTEIPKMGKVVALYPVKTPKDEKVLVDGKDILDARVEISGYSHKPVIAITMNLEGTQDWEIMTRKNVGRAIAITMDNKVLSCPVVNSMISSGSVEISANFRRGEAEELAARINRARK